jgi:PLD-like domain
MNRMIAGPLNGQFLENLLNSMMEDCSRVRAAIAYAGNDNRKLFEACKEFLKPLEFYGRYDHTVPISPEVLKWFLDQNSPNAVCRLVPDILHAKVIWWVDAGAYVGSANLSDRAWYSNIEAGIWLTQQQLLDEGLEQELRQFFEKVDSRSHPLTNEIYQEQLLLQKTRREVESKERQIEEGFNKSRQLPLNQGVSFVENKKSIDKRKEKFLASWNEALQTMRTIAERVSNEENRPTWIDPSVPPGVQADQFLHAVYYSRVREGNRYPYEAHYIRNSANPETALREALAWWKEGAFDHSFEERTIYEWAPHIRSSFSRDRIRSLNKSAFVSAFSMIHAVRDHASKQANVELGLPDSPQINEDKVLKYAEAMWDRRSINGKSVLELLEFAIWGQGEVAERLWLATHDSTWTIPHIGLSTLGEVVGWARPTDYPPRNMRTSKGLRALGFNVHVGG